MRRSAKLLSLPLRKSFKPPRSRLKSPLSFMTEGSVLPWQPNRRLEHLQLHLLQHLPRQLLKQLLQLKAAAVAELTLTARHAVAARTLQQEETSRRHKASFRPSRRSRRMILPRLWSMPSCQRKEAAPRPTMSLLTLSRTPTPLLRSETLNSNRYRPRNRARRINSKSEGIVDELFCYMF